MSDAELFGGIEAGGTKFICAVSSNPPILIDKIQFNTTTPDQTIEKVCEYFYPYIKKGRLKSIGIASFGPVDVDVLSSTYGYITTTPKPYWETTNILGQLKKELAIPIAFHHDVTASAIGEYKWGASKDIDPSLYITIGTGIGGGYIFNGKPVTGISVLEMGHIYLPHDFIQDPFSGNCPYHCDCFEGLASGPAIEKRLDKPAEMLSDDDPFWKIEAGYIAYAITNYILSFSPRIIVIGGGVMQRSFLYKKIRKKVNDLLNNYLKYKIFSEDIERYIVPPSLGKYSGVLGAISMAMDLYK